MTDPLTGREGWTMWSKVLGGVLTAILIASLFAAFDQRAENANAQTFRGHVEKQLDSLTTTQVGHNDMLISQVRINTETEGRLREMAGVLADLRESFRDFKGDTLDHTRNRITADQVSDLILPLHSRMDMIDEQLAEQIAGMDARLDARVTNAINELFKRQMQGDEERSRMSTTLTDLRERMIRIEERMQ